MMVMWFLMKCFKYLSNIFDLFLIFFKRLLNKLNLITFLFKFELAILI